MILILIITTSIIQLIIITNQTTITQTSGHSKAGELDLLTVLRFAKAGPERIQYMEVLSYKQLSYSTWKYYRIVFPLSYCIIV